MLDGLRAKTKRKEEPCRLPSVRRQVSSAAVSVWFRPRGGRQEFFYTEDSGKYISPLQQIRRREGFSPNRPGAVFDGAAARFSSRRRKRQIVFHCRKPSLSARRVSRGAVFASETVYRLLRGTVGGVRDSFVFGLNRLRRGLS
ncbi:MAG TPA: hypothetical protein ENJ77_00095, partial [Candidatus Moranbacteria bacterium]|nr:hypothetical protein [Candidatus Moranbacteria bacterium]